MRQLFFIIGIIASLVSCTKEIDIDLNSSSPQLVVEANLTDTAGPYTVKLTRTVNFSDPNNYPAVSNAVVIISDNQGATDTLLESSAGIYHTTHIAGMPGNSYKLTVQVGDKLYNAVSTMPLKVNLDSIRFNPISFFGINTYGVVPVYADPQQAGNNYRFVQTLNGEADKEYIVFNDYVANGTVNQRPIVSNGDAIKLGDTVSITMRCIDKSMYDYYFTLSEFSQSGTSGVTPSNPPNNISGNNALGYFSAHTTQTVTRIVK